MTEEQVGSHAIHCHSLLPRNQCEGTSTGSARLVQGGGGLSPVEEHFPDSPAPLPKPYETETKLNNTKNRQVRWWEPVTSVLMGG